MTRFLTLLAVAASASLVACGGQDPTTPAATGQSREAANRRALLAFARCMRQHGVDMPDPQFRGGRVTQKAGTTDPDIARAADAACAKYRDQVRGPELSDADKERFKRAALANARCMREHGIPGFPDPTFDAQGGAQISLDRSLNPESAKFKRAADACADKTDRPSTTDAGAGER